MEQERFLIRGGMVIDGSGSPPRRADVRVAGERVRQISPGLAPVEGERVLPAEGAVVCPGFIDAHCHTDMYAWDVPDTCGKVMQGVTTDVCGLCGDSPAPIGSGSLEEFRRRREYQLPGGQALRAVTFSEYASAMDRRGCSTNMALFVGNSNLRIHAVGYEERPATARELDIMGGMLAESVAAGAFGLSTGLTYYPSQCASTQELTALCRAMAPLGGIYNSHMRNESGHILQAIQEVIDIARDSGCRGHISHLKVSGRRNHGRADQCLEQIHRAQDQGVDITFDVYPYTAGSCGLRTLLPLEILERGFERSHLLAADTLAQCRQRLLDSDWDNLLLSCGGENIIIASGPEGTQGQSIARLMEWSGLDGAELLCRLLCRTGGQGSILYHALAEEDLRSFMKDPLCSIGTDAFARNYTGPTAAGMPHPRNYGAFPRWFRHYVLDEGIFSIEEGVRKVTAIPAAQFGLSGLGRLEEGERADITVFCPDTIREMGDFLHPNRPPEGIRYVMLRGRLAVDQGEFQPVGAGGVVRSQGVRS